MYGYQSESDKASNHESIFRNLSPLCAIKERFQVRLIADFDRLISHAAASSPAVKSDEDRALIHSSSRAIPK